MAAGLGFKDFVTGEVLTAADVDGYLMQGVWVFASAAARDAAVTSPQEGNFAYLKDTNVTTYYTGSAWANLDTTGMTNPMTTTGDIIYSSPGSTPVRLGIGTANQVLRVNSGATAPEWATPAGGGKVLQVIQVTTTTPVTSSTNAQVTTGMTASITPSSASNKVMILSSTTFQKSNGNASTRIQVQVKRGATQIAVSENICLTGAAEETFESWAITFLDSPATTSSTTYDITFANAQNVASVSAQPSNSTGSIILMEIGA